MGIVRNLIFLTLMALPPNGTSLFFKGSDSKDSKPSKNNTRALMRALAKVPRK